MQRLLHYELTGVNAGNPVADVIAVAGGLLVVQARLRGEPSQVVIGVGDYIHQCAVVGYGGGERPLHRVVGHGVDIDMVGRVGGVLVADSERLAGKREVHVVMLIATHGVALVALYHIAVAIVIQAFY